MLLTLVEILIFMILAALVGLILGWILRGSMSTDQQDIADLRSKLRECKKARREAEKAANAQTEASNEEASTATSKTQSTKPASKQVDTDDTDDDKEAQKTAARAEVAKLVERIGSDDTSDDLTAIYGIGPKFAGMLNDMGITSFKQISQFKADDIDAVASAIGAFRDRVERDDWVAGAKTAYKEQYGKAV